MKQLIHGYGEYMSTYPWEWYATFTYPTKVRINLASGMLKQWGLHLQKKEGIQIAYMGAFNNKNNTPHYHLLLFARNKLGKTLVDVDREYWQNRWKGIAKIVPYEYIEQCAYTAKNFLYQHCDAELITYNHKLLMKHQKDT